MRSSLGVLLQARTGRLGATVLVALVALALVGPFFAPHDPAEIVGPSFSQPGSNGLFGTDLIGRDVLSRVLWGGRSIIGLSVAATLIAYAVGVAIGLIAGYSRSLLDALLMRAMDVLLAFPPLILLLVLATGAGQNLFVLVLGISLVQIPGIARVVRSAALQTSVRGFVEAAVARGEGSPAVIFREILPNITGTILADAGVRFTYAILLVASVNFLGLGLQPPAADWSVMIAENRGSIALQPWPVLVPAILIALLTISVNLIADGIVRSFLGSAGQKRKRS